MARPFTLLALLCSLRTSAMLATNKHQSTAKTVSSNDHCIIQYANEVAKTVAPFMQHHENKTPNYRALYAERWRSHVIEQMTLDDENFAAAAEQTQQKLFLCVGPGSSGTRSLFIACAILGIGGGHYDYVYRPDQCAIKHRGVFKNMSSMIDLAKVDTDLVFWGDTPVPWQWPAVRRRTPNAKYIMTDLNATLWRAKRLDDHCSKEAKGHDSGCLVPLPFEPHSSWFPVLHVSAASSQLTEAAFAAYRQFVRCTIPPERLLWIDYSLTPFSSATLWNELISFSSVDDETRIPAWPDGRLVPVNETPWPHWGSSTNGCAWGDDKCCAALCAGQNCERSPEWLKEQSNHGSHGDDSAFNKGKLTRGQKISQHVGQKKIISDDRTPPQLILGAHHKTGTWLAQGLARAFFPDRSIVQMGRNNRHSAERLSKQLSRLDSKTPSIVIFNCLDSKAFEMILNSGFDFRLVHVIREPVELVISAYMYHRESDDTQLVPGVGPSVFANMALRDGLRTEAQVINTPSFLAIASFVLSHARPDHRAIFEVRYQRSRAR